MITTEHTATAPIYKGAEARAVNATDGTEIWTLSDYTSHNFTGVSVTIDVIDSNGNYRNIGTTTTDSSGIFSLTWTPDIAGNYKVIATFHGTNCYWPSYSETNFNVMQAAATSTPPPSALASNTDMYILGSAIAIIIVIIIVGAVIILMQRRRP